MLIFRASQVSASLNQFTKNECKSEEGGYSHVIFLNWSFKSSIVDTGYEMTLWLKSQSMGAQGFKNELFGNQINLLWLT